MYRPVHLAALSAVLVLSACTATTSDFSEPPLESRTEAAKKPKIDICHVTGNGSFHLINVNQNSETAHLNHGDHLPLDVYLDVDGDGFGDPGTLLAGDCLNDGYVDNGDDCDDADADISPDATEVCDGIDNNCDGNVDEGFDVDNDGQTSCAGDCDDNDPNNFTGNPEVCDGQDNDCNGLDDVLGFDGSETDDDADGQAECEGDCDDGDADNYSGNAEICDFQDNDCDTDIDEGFDVDSDGFSVCDGDCNDLDANFYPGAPELCDGLDNDCDGATPADELDADNDGFAACAGDCNDVQANTYPGAPEICDLQDNDCDGLLPSNELDLDFDAFTPCQGDCSDVDADFYPGAPELCDGLDNDCDGAVPSDELDVDADGFAACAGDCNDADIDFYPGAPELCDGLDNDCDGATPTDELDVDADGVSECEGDCDDANVAVFPGNVEVCDDAIDNECDTLVDCDDADCLGDPACSSGLFVADGRGANAGNLYEVDLNTLTYTTVGAISHPITGMAFAPDGTLYATEAGAGNPTPDLFSINTTTGAGTFVSDIQPAPSRSNVPNLAGLTFVGSRLLGWYEAFPDDLTEITITTGATTILGNSGLNTYGAGLAADTAGTVYFTGEGLGNELYTLNAVTGAPTLVGSMTEPPSLTSSSAVDCLTFHNGTLYGVAHEFDVETWLVSLDLNTLEWTIVMQLPDGIDAIASDTP